jgi:hypothetical protein
MPIPPEQRLNIPATATTFEDQNEYWRQTMGWTDRLPFFPTQIERRRAVDTGYAINWGGTFSGSGTSIKWDNGAGGFEPCKITFWKNEPWTGIELTVHMQMFTSLSTARDVSIETRTSIAYAAFSGAFITAPTSSAYETGAYLGFKLINSATANQHQAWSHTCIIPPHAAGWATYTIEVEAIGAAGGLGTLRADSNDEICIVAKEMPYWQTVEPPLS